MVKKFQNTDRHRLISQIENQLGLQFAKLGRKDKIRRDDSGNLWVIIGGVDLWQSVAADDLDLVERTIAGTNRKATLVFGHWTSRHVDVYSAPLNPYFDRKHIFTNMQLSVDGRTARIEKSDCRMMKWFEFPHTESDHESQRKFDEGVKLVETMSGEELARLLERLRAPNKTLC